jgi:MauM/NapG family ferredoxin protein
LIRNVRRVIQIFFFLLFVWLLTKTEYAGVNEIPYPVKIFFDFDPLVGLANILAFKGVPPFFPKVMALSLIVVGITLVFGRVFCGWVCPLGAINNFFSYLKKRKLSGAVSVSTYHWGQQIKYLILIGLLVAALFGLQLAGFIDPFSILIRSTSVSINPAVNYLIRGAFDTIYYSRLSFLGVITEPAYLFLQNHYLSFNQPYFQWSFLIGIVFILIIFLNLVRPRFWCRYLCPLGALLGVLSRYSLFRLKFGKGCIDCNICISVCPAAAEPKGEGSWRSSECFICYNCIDACPEKVLSFRFSLPRRKERGLDLSRRKLIASMAVGLASVPLIKVGTSYKKPNPTLIRPPGALIEEEFLKRCVRCGECMKVCLNNALHPTLFEAGLEGMFTPRLIPRLGYCEYYCTLCGQVCPTGAIRELNMEEKTKTRIGLAIIDKSRCLPYSLGVNCVVCEEVCPTPEKAIWLEEKEVVNRRGERVTVKQPHVDPELCVGCGICEYKCPLTEKPAIFVINMNETRDPEKKLLI